MYQPANRYNFTHHARTASRAPSPEPPSPEPRVPSAEPRVRAHGPPRGFGKIPPCPSSNTGVKTAVRLSRRSSPPNAWPPVLPVKAETWRSCSRHLEWSAEAMPALADPSRPFQPAAAVPAVPRVRAAKTDASHPNPRRDTDHEPRTTALTQEGLCIVATKSKSSPTR